MPFYDTAVTSLHALSLVALRLAVTAAVLALGFQALSDDDFARVALAQAFAHTPHLDPTGTSWLPLPFWVNGIAMSVFGRDLAVARAVTIFLGCASSVLLYGAARAAGLQAHTAWAGAVAATLLPLSMVTGAAMVPELPTASLCAAAMILLIRPDWRAAVAAAALVLPATLCRYEAWPVAAFIAAYGWVPLLRLRRAGTAEERPRELGARALASGLALAGPVAWLTWNAYAHGDAFHFHTRVASFWTAWGAGHADMWSRLLTYPRAMVTEAPVLLIALAGAALWARSREPLQRWRAPAACALLVLLALSAAQATGGAPTHHSERPLLMVWLAGWIAVADLVSVARFRSHRGWPWSVAAISLSVVAWFAVRMVHAAPFYGVHRQQEARVGAWLHDNAHQGDVLLEPRDYGYFATIAKFGAPERVVLGRSVDPRAAPAPSPFRDEDALRARLQQSQIRWLVASGTAIDTASRVGTVRARLDDWIVVECGDTR